MYERTRTHTHGHTHRVQCAHAPSEDHDDEGKFLLLPHVNRSPELHAEEGSSTTCKDTPLRQRGHMEVLHWLLGEQGGGVEEMNVVRHQEEKKKKKGM